MAHSAPAYGTRTPRLRHHLNFKIEKKCHRAGIRLPALWTLVSRPAHSRALGALRPDFQFSTVRLLAPVAADTCAAVRCAAALFSFKAKSMAPLIRDLRMGQAHLGQNLRVSPARRSAWVLTAWQRRQSDWWLVGS
jgi:hypothetical protein